MTVHKKAIIHQLTTMLSTLKNVLFPGHSHLLTTGAADPSLWLSPKVDSMVVSWWIVAFFVQCEG